MSAIRYGWNTAERTIDSWWIGFAPITREPGSWKEEIYAAARDIASRTKKPLWICSSGGIDSEIACRAFFDQGINFSVLTFEHVAGTNRHDMQYAVKWCAARGVRQKVVPFDMERFLASEIDAYTERYVAFHPFRYLQIKLMETVEEMGGFAVLGGGEQVYEVDRTKSLLTRDDMHSTFGVGKIAALEWCKDNNTDHEPYFHFATPELCLAYLRLPLITFVLDHPETVFRHPANTYTLKRLVYQSVWTDIETRYKSHGFENVRPLVLEAVERLRRKYGELHIYRLPVTTFEHQLVGKPI